MKSVYVASAGARRHKIGIAENPAKRVRALSGTAGRSLRLVTVHRVKDASAVERMTHWLLAGSRGLGEWFGVTEAEANAAIIEAVRRVEEGGHAPVRAVFPIRITLPMTREMLARADAAIGEGEDRVSLIRKAIDAELKRRERAKG